jgi:hypothetical protein
MAKAKKAVKKSAPKKTVSARTSKKAKAAPKKREFKARATPIKQLIKQGRNKQIRSVKDVSGQRWVGKKGSKKLTAITGGDKGAKTRKIAPKTPSSKTGKGS